MRSCITQHKDLGIKLKFASVAYPHCNGQVEAANKSIVNDLKKRLQGAKGKWAENLPLVLWANRTTIKQATGESPFSLAYGVEAVTPVEHMYPNDRILSYFEDANDENFSLEIELREEVRDQATIHSANQKAIVARHYNKYVRLRGFAKGDLVLRWVEGNKLDPNWEGPYIVDAEVAPGAYKLVEQRQPRS